MLKLIKATVLLLGMTMSGPAAGQQFGLPVSNVLIVDADRAYSASLAGQSINKDLEERLAELVGENRRLEAELEAEERELTELRPTLSADEFRELAAAFDEKAQRIREEQYTKQDELNRLGEEERARFLERLAPILSRIAVERGALMIMEKRNVLLAADVVDITDEAIARINAQIEAETNSVAGGDEDSTNE